MGIKVFISSQTGNAKIRNQQTKILSILESFKIDFEEVDVCDPLRAEDKKFMWANAKSRQSGQKPLPPQVFLDDEYLGDFDDFEVAIETDKVYEFFKLAEEKAVSEASVSITGGSDD